MRTKFGVKINDKKLNFGTGLVKIQLLLSLDSGTMDYIAKTTNARHYTTV